MRRAGFTLLELLLVLAILGLAAGLVLPSLSGSLASARFRAGAAELRAAMVQARGRAAATGRVRSLRLDLDRGEYALPDERVSRALPEGVRMASVSLPSGTVERGVVSFRFFPDGGADAAEVVLAGEGGGKVRLTVDPLTGVVEAGS